jgi:hypothetical protein
MIRAIAARFCAGTLVLAAVLALSAAPGTADATGKESASKDTKGKSPLTTTTHVGDLEVSWTRLENRLTMRAPFNEMKGKVRVIAFFSPTCPRCLKNAGEIQGQFLEKNDSDDFRIQIVWVKSLSTDSEETLPLAINQIQDPRVSHYWDADRALNPQLIDAIMFEIQMNIYDVFLIYNREQTWEKRLPRPDYFFHEVKNMPGPWWDASDFIEIMRTALKGEPLESPW